MVKRCAHGTCNSDARFPDRVQGVTFYPFPKPKSNLEKCLRWIKACNRPSHQLNIHNITRNTYVCSKHFKDEKGPTEEYPDPLLAVHGGHVVHKPSRPPPKRRKIVCISSNQGARDDTGPTTSDDSNTLPDKTQDASSQTDNAWINPMDMLLVVTENANLSSEKEKILAEKQKMVAEFDTLYQKSYTYKKDKSSQTYFARGFNIENVMTDDKQFKYSTGYQSSQFENLYKFLVPNVDEIPIKYPTNRLSEAMRLVLKDQLFLTIMKLRHNFHHDDLAYRFGVSKQTVSVIFSHWVNYMFLRFGEISFWPPRDAIKEHMPTKYAEEFPTTFAILDCTEIRITKPSSLKAQSQTYSDYKSGNTLKGLVACDPRGSVIFASMLFSGAMSDREIFVQSGFQEMLKDLVKEGYLLEGDGLMADKGFNIEEEVRKCGLVLNIPPFSRHGKQMSSSDALLTKKIAKHRVHVERAIERIKRFKILAGKVDLTLFSQINQIWFVCAFMTNFFPPAIQEENN